MTQKAKSKNSLYKNVCEVIVPADMCIGCGICVPVCPVDVLEMQFNQFGELIPVEVREGCLPCPICLQACPFYNQKDNEDSLALAAFSSQTDIKHRPETGYYLKAFVGHVKDQEYRLNRSSGGLAAWLQESYLAQGLADYVISVVPNNDPEKRFRFAIFDSLEQVKQSAKSAYYPVDMSEVIAQVLHTPGSYVFTGLPCFIKGLKLTMRHNITLRKRIRATIGLVCGQQKSKFFGEYLVANHGGSQSQISQLDFRFKDPRKSANEFGLMYETRAESKRSEQHVISDPETFILMWQSDSFKINACNYCDDIFAELADAVVMDAWLSPYQQDWQGHSIMLFRKEEPMHLLQSGLAKGDLWGKEIDIEQVIACQSGVVEKKRSHLAYRLHMSKESGHDYIPIKRVAPKKPPVTDRILISSQLAIQHASREKFTELADGDSEEKAKQFKREMAGRLRGYRISRRLFRVLNDSSPYRKVHSILRNVLRF
jgi:coenzyme F420-reducing hydrogenase beta subunit